MVLLSSGLTRAGYQATKKSCGKDILVNCGGSVTWQNLQENNLAIMKKVIQFDPLIPLLGVFLSK